MRRTKLRSSRRKGDEYQDLTALQLVLESYIEHLDFKIFIEYEKAGSLDDIVIVLPDEIHAYQVKYAVNDNSVYTVNDLTDPASVVFFEKFAKSWKKIKEEFHSHQLLIHLRSNRSLDAQLSEIVTTEGFFDDKFRENRYRKEKRHIRRAIFESTCLTEQEFREFLSVFHFDLKQLSWLKLENHIQATLLDHKLGISDYRIFSALKRLIESHSIEVSDPVTSQIVDSFLRQTQTRYLLPQSFSVDQERFVDPPTFKDQLNDQLSTADGEYVVITGPPGSGKSTALTKYCDELEETASDRYIIVRYYCFIRVHDNRQRMRLEAKSLRVNLLTELQRKFPNVLDDRRFDYDENRFYESLERISQHCRTQQKKLIVFLDGLDHVERDDKVLHSVISALPHDIPENVVLLIGTQELNHWTPLALKEGRDRCHISMPLFTRDETRTYLIDRCGIIISDEMVTQAFKKSAGLPLYLRYLSEWIDSSEDLAAKIDAIPAAVEGNIRAYYETLWGAFDIEGRSDAKYLSSVLASLRFSVHENELSSFQTGISNTPRFEAAYRRVQHLLRRDNALVSVFHNSFRMFVLERTSESVCLEISAGILSRLKQEELQSTRWFKYAFQYGLDAREFNYVISKINGEYVDSALARFRAKEEIFDGIECAIEAAGAVADLVSLSRLGSLKYRTHERLEYVFPWPIMTDILLHEGHIDHVVGSIHSEESDRVIVDNGHLFSIILKLAELDKYELGRKIFKAFLKEFQSGEKLEKDDLVAFAECAGIFKIRPAPVIRWLAGMNLKPGILEVDDLSVQYAPHYSAYLNGLVRNGHENVWHKLKQTNLPFPNRLTRQLIIRAIAHWGSGNKLRSEVEEYAAKYPHDSNLELGFYAVQSGLSVEFVNELAGQFIFPPKVLDNKMLRTELQSHLLRFAHWAVIFGYEQNNTVRRQLRARLPKSEAVWTCVQLHLLYVGQMLGSHYADREIDWFGCATKAIEALEGANDVPNERTPDVLDATRFILDRSLRWLSKVVVERCQDKVIQWVELLKRLRSSFIWTTHYGFNEPMTDYSFELTIWNNLADLPVVRAQLRPILQDCARSYEEALSLKGGARGDHFLMLAAIAVKCGFSNETSAWRKQGIQDSLAYGYRKDITLEKLTDVLTLMGKYYPEKVLESAAAILELIKWVPSATDGRCTQHFAQYLLPTILIHNRAAALEALRSYYKVFATWQADESVAKYISARDGGDPEFLWALCGLLRPNQSLEHRGHVATLAASSKTKPADSWTARLADYTAVMINPRHWPDELWTEVTKVHERPVRQHRHQSTNSDDSKDKTYKLGGQEITLEEAISRCKSSFNEMAVTLEKLERGNDYVPTYELLSVLPEHIGNTSSAEELSAIKSFYEETPSLWRKSSYWEKIGRKFLEFGNVPNGLMCMEQAFHEGPMSKALNTLVEYDRDRAVNFLVNDLTERLHGPSYQCFDAPNIVAHALDVLEDGNAVQKVFDNFSLHCQELFSQWPNDLSFKRLRDWVDVDQDEGTQILQLLIDRLATHEAELGDRLVYTICMVAENRSEKVFPILSERVSVANGLLLWRLLQVYVRLSYTSQPLFRKHCQALIPLLERSDIYMALVASRTIQSAFAEVGLMNNDLQQAVDGVSRRYSSVIAYRGFSILKTSPSAEFVELVKHAAQAPFHRQLTAICQILDLDKESITAQLERDILATGSTLEEEKEKSRSMWRAFSHAQGWPIIWFFSDFHVAISNMLFKKVDEILVKGRYQSHHLEAVWRVTQQSDPEYSDSHLVRKPEDIAPLFVHDKDQWMSSDEDVALVIREGTMSEEWVSAFEFRELGQDGTFHREFVTQTDVYSALVMPSAIDNIASFETQCWIEPVVTHHPEENLTWKQYREALRHEHHRESDFEGACFPFVSCQRRHAGFLGFRVIASLSSWIIQEQNLKLDGFSVFANGEQVAHFEAWQEGYSNEAYCNEPLSYGVRVRVRRKFVESVCQNTGRQFAIRTVENRYLLKDYKPDPVESCSRTSICVWPIHR